jgi:hypothetical protein
VADGPRSSEEAAKRAAVIRKAVSDDEIVDQAAETNAQITKERIDIGIVKPKVIEIYKEIAERKR